MIVDMRARMEDPKGPRLGLELVFMDLIELL